MSSAIAPTLPAMPSTAIITTDAIQLSGNTNRHQIRGASQGIALPSSAAIQHEKRNEMPKTRTSSNSGVPSVAPLKAKTTASEARMFPTRIRRQ